MNTSPIASAAGLLRNPVVWVITGAWVVALGVHAANFQHPLHHEHLGVPDPSVWVGAAAFMVLWQVHVMAIMLPSSLPMIRLFHHAAAGQDRPRWVRASFLCGYLAVWTIFGIVSCGGEGVLSRLALGIPALDSRPWLVTGVVLAGAGGFQFTDLKDRCLRECRLPQSYLRGHYQRGVGAAFRIGAGHGLFCIGCCWALMMAMLAVGFANIVWMAPFAALMVAEKVAPWGERLVVPAGMTLILAGFLVAMNPW